MHLGLLRPRRFLDALVEVMAAPAGEVVVMMGWLSVLLMLRAGDEAAICM